MTLPLPDIDTTDFEELVDQSRLAIPRYCDTWTDHNAHDPGMMLIELAAWLVDQQIYSAGFVSDEHLAAFASLFGVSPRAAQPARGLVWPDDDALPSDPTVPGANLPVRSIAVTRQQGNVIFRTRSDTHLTPARSAPHAGGTPVISGAGTDRSLLLTFDRPLVEESNEAAMPIAVGIELSGLSSQPISGAEGRLVADYRLTASESDSSVDVWQRLDIVSDTTAALSRSGVLYVRVPGAALETSVAEKRGSELRLGLRYRTNPVVPQLRRVAVNVLAVEQRSIVDEAVLGTSTGYPDQSYPLELSGIDPQRPPVIDVEENTTFVAWESIRSLAAAGPEQRACAFGTAAGRVLFGNGVNGRVPPRSAQIRHRPYVVTRGAGGNLTAHLDWQVTGAALSVGAHRFGTNPQAMAGGEDAWDAGRLRVAARQRALHRLALVTNRDIANMADRLATIGVREAEVLVGFDPARPRANTPNSRTLLITPGASPAMPAQQYVAAVRDVVTPGRVIGERLHVAIKVERSIDVNATILIRDGVDPDPVRTAIDVALRRRLAPVRIADDTEPWPPGRAVELGEIETLIAHADGVVSVLACRIGDSGGPLSSRSIPLDPDTVAVLGSLSLAHRSDHRTGNVR